MTMHAPSLQPSTVPARRRSHSGGARRPSRGAASLTVVMILFLIISLAAAYTSRNLIFEQRTAGNQYRSTQAFEAAEAGLEWALAMLNSGRIDAACAPGTAGDTSFRQRYLDIDVTSDGLTTPRTRPAGALAADGGGDLWPSCVFNGTDWDCSCPDNGVPVLVAPVGAGVFPAFRVRFVRVLPPAAPASPQPGLVRVDVNGCTRLDDACLDFPAAAVGGEGRATLSTLVTLKPALGLTEGDAPNPAAALTVRGNLALGGGANVMMVNTDAAGGGLTLQTGDSTVDESHLRSVTVAGSPADASRALGDVALNTLSDAPPPSTLTAADRFFALTFGTPRAVYVEQPALLGLDCAGGPCSAAPVRALAALNPGRVIHVRGDLEVDAGDVGSATDPVLLVLDGDLDLQDPAARIFGLVYGQDTTFAVAGNGEVRGAVVAETDFSSNDSPTIVHDASVLRRLQLQHGSFVRVPGSWRDFP